MGGGVNVRGREARELPVSLFNLLGCDSPPAPVDLLPCAQQLRQVVCDADFPDTQEAELLSRRPAAAQAALHSGEFRPGALIGPDGLVSADARSNFTYH